MSDDDTRNMALASATADIVEYITSRLGILADQTGETADFHLTCVIGDMAETAFQVTDFDMMADALGGQVARWIEAGHVDLIDDEDDDPLFTATFDPTKIRAS
jgi:hypothetical protein